MARLFRCLAVVVAIARVAAQDIGRGLPPKLEPPAPGVAVAEQQDLDAFIAGYVTAAIERDLDLPRASFHVVVERGMTTVYLAPVSEERRANVAELLAGIEGLGGFAVANWTPGATRAPAPLRSRIRSDPELFLPAARPVFPPLLADPKEPSIYASWRRYDPDNGAGVDIGDIGLGGTIPVWRSHREREDPLALGIAGGVFAQFEMDEQADLFNTDFVAALPFEWRRGSFSARLRPYHQSSHLGDEFLLRTRTPRVNLSFMSFELLAAYEVAGFRAYGGGEYLVLKDPTELDAWIVHWGAEYRSPSKILDAFRLGIGWDVKHFEEHDFSPDRSLKAGLIFGDFAKEVRVMVEWFQGYSPHGQQFFAEKLSYLGIGLYYNF